MIIIKSNKINKIILILSVLVISVTAISFVSSCVNTGGSNSDAVASEDSFSKSEIIEEISSVSSLSPEPESVVESGRNFDANVSGIPVVLYHHILTQDEKNKSAYKNNEITTALEEFDSQMKILFENGYKTITSDTLLKYINGEIRVPKKSILITFDDGYKSTTHHAAPVLRKYGFTAINFMFTQDIDIAPTQEFIFNSPVWQYINREEMNANSDVYEYACHMNDPEVHNNIKTSSMTIIEDDIKKSLQTMPTELFAYPLGFYNNNFINVLKQNNFKMSFTTERGYAKTGVNPYLIPRFTILHNTSDNVFLRLIETGVR